MNFKHKKAIISLSLLLCFGFLIGSLLTPTAQAQTAGIVVSSDNSWNGSNSVELGPNVFGQVMFRFTPSQTCTLNTIGFYAKGTTATVKIYPQTSTSSWSYGAMLGQATATLISTSPQYYMQYEHADFSSQNIVLTSGTTYIVSIMNNAYPPIFLFSTDTINSNTWNWTGTGGFINNLFYEVRGTPYNVNNPTPSPTPYNTNNPTPSPTPYNYNNPTPTPYVFPTPTQPPTYILGYGFSSTDLIIIIVVVAIIMGCSVFVSMNLNKSNRPRKNGKKHK